MKVYIAYSHISSDVQNSKTVLDADTDADKLRQRINEYMASPKMVNFNRGVAHEIEVGEYRSRDYYGSGGGCSYYAWLTIEEVIPLTVEDRT